LSSAVNEPQFALKLAQNAALLSGVQELPESEGVDASLIAASGGNELRLVLHPSKPVTTSRTADRPVVFFIAVPTDP
jgi:hypothetical protein